MCRNNFLSNIERKEQQKQKERKELETKLAAEKASRHKEVKQLTDQRDKLLGAEPRTPTPTPHMHASRRRLPPDSFRDSELLKCPVVQPKLRKSTQPPKPKWST